MDNDQSVEQTEWYQRNHEALLARTAFLASLPEGVVHARPGSMHQLRLERRGNQLQMFFLGEESNEVLSRFNINDPLDLVSPYTQVMMLTLAWCPEPKSVYMLGLGAGRVPMIFHHYLPSVVVDNTELDKDVVEVAKQYFGIAFDQRLRIYIEDGRKFLERKQPPAQYDIILLDAFTGIGSSPFSLSTIEFYRLCKQNLAPNGVVSVNLLNADPLFRPKVGTFIAAFRNVYAVKTILGGSVFFGTDADSIMTAEIESRAQRIQEQFKFRFPFVEHVRRMQQLAHNGEVVDQTFRTAVLSDATPPMVPLPKFSTKGVGRNDLCPCGSGRKFKKCHGA